MKFLCKTVAFIFILQFSVYAQYPDPTAFETIEVNNIKTGIRSDGIFFWNLEDQHYTVPKDDSIFSIFSAALWLGGIDAGGQLKLAAQTYRQTGSDFYPGPANDSTALDSASRIAWDKVWKISKTQIDQHIMDFIDNGIIDNPQPAIMRWPGAGNIYARGKNNVALNVPPNMAPFYDLNLNNLYDPLKGDFPAIKGDQMLWCVFNDNTVLHTETGGQIVNSEIHLSVYGFNCPDDSVLYNTLFMNFQVINKDSISFEDFYVGNFVDFDLGCFTDDYVGCDTISNTFYAYNGIIYDSSSVDSSCATPGYRDNPPIQTVTFLDQKMATFAYYNNDFSIIGNPPGAAASYNYMRGFWGDNTPFTKDTCIGYGGTDTTSYMYSGNPANLLFPNSWSECSCSNQPGDRRGLGSIGPFTFNPGQIIDMTVAYSTHFLPFNGCPDFTPYRQRIQHIQQQFDNGLLHGCDTAMLTCGDTALGCVWPGDANNDGIANMRDVLPIGIGYDTTGPVRPNATTTWTGQPMQDWPQNFINIGENYKHADCDGNGTIDSFDFQPILDNYGLVHFKTQNNSNKTGVPFTFQIPPGPHSAGSTLAVPILLGDSVHQVANFYAMAFSLTYNTNVVQPGSITVDFNNSWVGTQNVDMKGLYKDLSAQAQLDIGLTRIDHFNRAGYGPIGIVNFILIDDIAGKGTMKLERYLNLQITDAIAIANDESEIELDIINSVDPSMEKEGFVSVYPNPVTGELTIEVPNHPTSFNYEIVNILGSTMKKGSSPGQSTRIDLSALPSGIYFVKVYLEDSVVSKKIVKR